MINQDNKLAGYKVNTQKLFEPFIEKINQNIKR